MPEQSRLEPGSLSGPTSLNPPELAKGALATPMPKTVVSNEPISIASLAAKAPEAFKPFDLGKPDAGLAAKLSAVSSRPKDGKGAATKAESQQQPAEKRRMSSIAPETAKAAEPAKADAKDMTKADMTKVETPRMPAGKLTVTPLGERAWEIKGLTPPKTPEAAKSAEPAKADAPKAATSKFNVAGLAGKVLGFAAFASRPRAKAKGQTPKGEAAIKPETAPKTDTAPGSKPAAAIADKIAADRIAADRIAADKIAKGKRRVNALAASVAVAAIAGAVGGALATSVMMRTGGDATASASADPDLQSSVTRISGDVETLKANVDQIAKAGQGLMTDTGERLDRLEREQAETSARLLKFGEGTTDRVRSTAQSNAMAAVAPVLPRDTTGSVTQSATTSTTMAAAPPQTRAAAPKTDAGRLPIVEGWTLRDVSRGGAVIEGKHGFYEVYAGDPVPGLGRVDAIRRQDGRWVVVTTKGLVVQR
jgi:hypothetical protein